MLRKLLIVFAFLILAFVIVVALQPSHFRVARTAVITAPPAVVFANVNDLHTWQRFSPWAKLDPSAKISFDGPSAGTGAAFQWAGNRELGEGRMTITESRPDERIRFRLDFYKPFKGTSEAGFVFKPEAGGTAVTWSMEGENNFFFKAVGLFIDCEKMLGPQFEEGLANLKTLSETAK